MTPGVSTEPIHVGDTVGRACSDTWLSHGDGMGGCADPDCEAPAEVHDLGIECHMVDSDCWCRAAAAA